MSEQSQNENMEELMRLGISEDWAFTIALVADSATFATRSSVVVNHGVPKGPVFEPGHEPVSKEGRELLGRFSKVSEALLEASYNIRRGFSRTSDAVFAYRDSLKPVDVVPDGWGRPVQGIHYHESGDAKVLALPTTGRFHFDVTVPGSGDSITGERVELADAFKAATDMLRMFEPPTTAENVATDPEGWNKTDGMAPPKEAGERVIETVDDRGNACTAPAVVAVHCWGHGLDDRLRPIKWRYADGGGE
jgi:hypothetical protein